MTISIPDTFTINSSGKYIMSIRLWSGGLSFSVYNPERSQSFLYRNIEFDHSIPYIKSLKEIFFENEVLVRNYKRVSILFVSPQYTLIPKDIWKDKKEDDLLSFSFSNREKKVLYNIIEGSPAQVIFGVNEEIYEFCSRSIVAPTFIHHITPLLNILKKQSISDERNHLYVFVHQKMIDLICFNNGNLLLANSFTYKQFDDLLYYILNTWKQLKLDQLKDRLFLSGETMICDQLVQPLRTYIQHINHLEIPSEAYLLGGEILQAPIDLILHTICES